MVVCDQSVARGLFTGVWFVLLSVFLGCSMETEGKTRLAEVFVGLRDPRQAKKVEHDLAEMLVVAVARYWLARTISLKSRNGRTRKWAGCGSISSWERHPIARHVWTCLRDA